MSTKAQAVLEQIKTLPADEQREVCNEILQMEARRKQWDDQKSKLREL